MKHGMPKSRPFHRPATPAAPNRPGGPSAGGASHAAWMNTYRQARALFKQGDLTRALPLLQRVVESVPERHDPRRDLASTLYKLGRLSDALREYNEIAVRFPDQSEAANNVAGVLSVMGHQALAFQAVERALALDPGNTAAMTNLAEILKHMGDWQGSRDVYAAALSLAPTDAKLRLQYGMALVLLDDWGAGWPAMEAREAVLGTAVLFKEQSKRPRWSGAEPLDRKQLLIQHEQGLGDAIMGARFAKALAARGAIVHLRCPQPLVEFLSGAEGLGSCTAVGSPMPPHDFHIPLMSLMAALKVTPANLEGSPYLTPAGPCPPHLESLLPRDGIPTVALTWSGNPKHINDHRRSIKGELLAPLLSTPDIRFVAMQKDPAMEDVLSESLRDRLIDVGAQCRTFTDSAHALRRVDLAITVDTAVAHLAGAIGTPTLLCLPFAPDYRWGATGTRTPWYTSLTVLRQPEAMHWEPVIAEAIRLIVGDRSGPSLWRG